MIIVTTVFKYKDKPSDYKRLYQVFMASCAKHMPGVTVKTLKLDVPPAKDNRKPGIWTNTAKLRAQVNYIKTLKDDVVLADCDMLCLKPFDDVFKKYDFDIGITTKPPGVKSSCRINGGIIFIRNSAQARAWMQELLKINDRMYKDQAFHNEWRKKYYGMNQSALGYMLERAKTKARVKEFRTTIWNAVDCDWTNVTDKTRLVHIKGKLRACIDKGKSSSKLSRLIAAWNDYGGVKPKKKKKKKKKTKEIKQPAIIKPHPRRRRRSRFSRKQRSRV